MIVRQFVSSVLVFTSNGMFSFMGEFQQPLREKIHQGASLRKQKCKLNFRIYHLICHSHEFTIIEDSNYASSFPL